MPRRWLRYSSKCMNGSEADRLALKISDTAANAMLSENKASARIRILKVFVLSPSTVDLSGIDTVTPTFARMRRGWEVTVVISQ